MRGERSDRLCAVSAVEKGEEVGYREGKRWGEARAKRKAQLM